MLILNSFSEHMTGWKIGCDIFAAFGSVAGIGSAVTNAAIAYDRYRYVLKIGYTNLILKFFISISIILYQNHLESY